MMSFRRSVATATAGNIAFAALQWSTLIAVAKLGAGADLGTFAIAQALVSPVLALAGMNLRAIQATDFSRPIALASYSSFRWLSSISAAVACILVAAVSFGRHEAVSATTIMAISKVFEARSDLFHGQFQRAGRHDLIARSLILRGSTTVAAMAATLVATGSLTIALVAVAATSAVVAQVVDAALVKTIDKHNGASAAPLALLLVGWPMGVVLGANTLILNLPRFVIADRVNLEAVGTFASISYFIVAGSAVANAVAQAASPRLAALAAIGGMDEFKRLACQVVALLALVGAAGVVVAYGLGEEILGLVYSPAVAQQVDLLYAIMWAGVAVYCATGPGACLTALREFKFQGVVAVGNVVVMGIASVTLVSAFGLVGGAMAIGVTHVFKGVVLTWRVVKVVRRNPAAPADR
jgi:O-antigen/teichoic acid export membrane protein